MWNMEEKKIQGFEQAVRVLPLRLRQEAMALPEEQRARVEELRLRWGRPMAAVLPEGERPLGGEPVTGQELEQLLELASRASFHTVADQLRRGYLTVEGGHRVGLCGTAVVRDGELRGLRRRLSRRVSAGRRAGQLPVGAKPEEGRADAGGGGDAPTGRAGLGLRRLPGGLSAQPGCRNRAPSLLYLVSAADDRGGRGGFDGESLRVAGQGGAPAQPAAAAYR